MDNGVARIETLKFLGVEYADRKISFQNMRGLKSVESQLEWNDVVLEKLASKWLVTKSISVLADSP